MNESAGLLMFRRAGGGIEVLLGHPGGPFWASRHEGAWTANTGNGYYGGLQMDVRFQQTYGPELVRWKGLAHRWGYLEQIWVAERAYRSGRGFTPWPNTARYCGLL